MDNEQVNLHVERSAELAVKRVFAILGVDIDKPKEVEDFRENLRFGATLRRMADKGTVAMAVTIAIFLVTAAATGLVDSIVRHFK